MASRTRCALIGLLLAFAAVAPAACVTQEQRGTFALYRGTPQISSNVKLVGNDELDIVQYDARSRAPIVRYVLTEGEPVHVILVRDDFRSFSHVHPKPVGKGHYRVRVALDAGHRFYAFVASEPTGDAPQVFRFTLQAGAPPHHLDTSLEAPSTSALAGRYRVSLSAARLQAQTPHAIAARVTTRAGSPVSVQPFRGAQAHTVFVNPQTLQYIHVDAQPGGKAQMMLRVPPLPRGIYRMWLQFSAGRTITTAPFTLVAQ